MKLLISCLILGLTAVNGSPVKKGKTADSKQLTGNPWQDFVYNAQLDGLGKYWLFWTPDDETETITFEVHVEAHGFVGFGLSPNGGMPGSDVIIGWVRDSDGQVFFHDRHAVAEAEPLIDDSQDWTLLQAIQNDTHTILQFSRPYVTCDEDDRDVNEDTTRIIYSFTDTDPEDITGLDYHGPDNRGTKTLILLNYDAPNTTLPEDAVYTDLLLTENTIPRKRTTYWCEVQKLPQKESKHHVVMFEPMIQPGNEGLVHHIIVYTCAGEMNEEDHGFAWDCLDNVMPQDDQCSHAWFVWAVGMTQFYLPEHTGLPYYPGDDSFIRIEMHYDNPSHIEGRKDHSGMRVWMTPTLREYDAGVLAAGVGVNENQMIPPHFDGLKFRGHCTSDCLGTVISDNIPEADTMNVFGIYQHAHLLGRSIHTRLFRDGTEIEPMVVDDNYDFNYQEIRLLKEERSIIKDDMIVVECTYQSSEKNKMTIGGFATKNEMCLSFLYYYPALNLSMCMTEVPQHRSLEIIDDIEITRTFDKPPFFRITSPEEYENKTTVEVFQMQDWTNEALRAQYQDIVLEEEVDIFDVCLFGAQATKMRVDAPDLGEPWVDPDDGQCDDETDNAKNLIK